ncbi:hypothetical protein CHLNCDRAFT_137916 [Chlorella variabilis]|uniref:PX domain-containing protein n=1 Tax=Chlorella variabilis TaxID=554065 RepID=E1Z4U1_CHLVA|nr:hypothetical protein CHLNCDRAFT_137916 [Chlorella variabilis]EFN59116.1 hypothetical protein CHLNCDRAFT_137916 [Chlorella variabilis]|eukprot:XP_005851218.1 hypothetical protein CHLNCDRAFT_137916 [Chlorella variabilis]
MELALAALILAWLLTKTSTSLLGNVPLALVALLSLRWLFARLERQQRARLLAARAGRAWRRDLPPATPAPTFVPPSGAKPDAWRKFVRAPVVEEAWVRFCGSIVQEFIYDIWYSTITPDMEFPAEVRRLLNSGFGQLAQRARQLDLRLVMNDLAELFMEQLELYRDTRESILLATQQPTVLRDMSAAARDRAFQREMRAEKNLHPALQTPDGHYKYLRAVAEGAVAYLLDVQDLQRTAARSVCRELLASCVFRPLLGYCSPYYANKALYALMREARPMRAIGQKEAEEVSAALAMSRSEAMRGHWEFEQRLLHHVEAEDSALLKLREVRHRLRSKLSAQYSRSRSMDMLPAKVEANEQQHQQSLQRQRQQEQQEQQEEEHGVQQQQAEQRSPFDVFNVASAVAAVLMPRASAAAAQQQQDAGGEDCHDTPRLASSSGGWRLPAALSGLLQQRGRQSAEAEEAALLAGGSGDGDGWESVEASEASLTLPTRRDFSSAHLLAPLVDQAAVAGVTPRTMSSSSSASCGTMRAGFSGAARAKVVAADLNTTGSKDYVEFKIRVADNSDEWTVSRRYRNFESLHRQLRMYPTYRLKLPPKRIFVHSNNVEFVEERREGLDKYLQAVLAHDFLSQCADLYEFLRAGSQLYELASPPPPQRMQTLRKAASVIDKQQQLKMLGGLSRAVLDSTHSVGRGITSASGAVAGSVKQGVSELATASSKGVVRVTHGVAGAAGAAAGAVKGALTGSAASEMQPGLARRVKSVPSALDRVSSSSIEEAAAAAVAQRGSSGSALTQEKGSGFLDRANKVSFRMRRTMSRDPAQQQTEPSGHSGSASSIDSEQLAEQQDGHALTIGQAPSASLPASPGKKSSKLFSGLRRNKSRSASPTKQPRERSPARKPRRIGETSSSGGSGHDSGEGPALASSRGGAEESVPAHLASSLRISSPGPASPLASFPVEPSLELDDCAGISAPLYEMVDCVFMLQMRGFFRRQVFAVARQALSLVAGEAIDAYLTSKLRLLRQQHTIGRIISQIQASLWPGGVWYQYTPAAQALAAAAAQRQQAQQQQQQQQQHGPAAGNQAGTAPAPGSGGRYVRPAGMDPAKFLEPGGPPPLDEDEIREAVEALLLRRAPTALVRLIGKNAYASGTRDLFDMLQSQTYCHHLGYGMLEIAMVHLFPELKSLFRTLQHGGLS